MLNWTPKWTTLHGNSMSSPQTCLFYGRTSKLLGNLLSWPFRKKHFWQTPQLTKHLPDIAFCKTSSFSKASCWNTWIVTSPTVRYWMSPAASESYHLNQKTLLLILSLQTATLSILILICITLCGQYQYQHTNREYLIMV